MSSRKTRQIMRDTLSQDLSGPTGGATRILEGWFRPTSPSAPAAVLAFAPTPRARRAP